MDYDKDFEDGFEYTSLGALHYKHHPGSGKKLIFLHGMGASTRVWKKLMQFLSDDLDLFLLDLIGHGESDAPHMDYTISNQFQALREFIALRNTGDSYIFGHSYGGWIAAYYASQPYTCKGIILEDAAGLKESFDHILESKGMEEYKDSMLRSAMQMNSNKEYVMRSIIDSDFGEDQLTSDLLSKISVRAKIIWGSEDKVLDRNYAQIFQKGIRNSTLDIIDGAGHEPHFTHPKETSEIINQFIQE